MRVAEGAYLPVEHRADGAVGSDHDVVEAVVAVDDRGPRLLGYPSGEALVSGADHGLGIEALDGRALELGEPALELALGVPVALGEVAEADVVHVDSVKRCERVSHRLAG